MKHTEGAGQPGDAGAAEEHPHPVGAGPATPRSVSAGPATPRPVSAGPATPRPATAGPATPPHTPDRLIYLDHAATAPMLPEAVAAMTEELARLGNPSSLHNAGRRARRVVEESREQIAEAFSARPSEVIFTSGGTEADNLAIKGLFWARRADGPQRRRVLIPATEHHAVLDSAGWLVSVMWANNEVGTIAPIAELAAVCAEHGIPLHTDAVQAAAQVPVHFAESGSDALTITGHKLGGPVGAGALLLARDAQPVPVLHGGGQESDIRSGTLDAPAIRAFATAAQVVAKTRDSEATRLAALRDDLIARVRAAVPGAILNGAPPGPGRLPGYAHFSFPGCEGDALLMLLDAKGIACSTGSACTAGVAQPSHVLLAMGAGEARARGSLRFSFGATSAQEDCAAVGDVIGEAVERARRAGRS